VSLPDPREQRAPEGADERRHDQDPPDGGSREVAEEVAEELAESMDAGGMGRAGALATALVEDGALADAIGGWRGVIDSAAPSAVFLLAFAVTGQQLTPSVWAAIVSGALIAGWRLLRRQPLQQVLTGFVGVAFCAWLASRTGKAEDFYLPGLLWNVLYASVLAISALVRHPLVGYLVGALTGDLTGWRSQPVLRRTYTAVTWIFVGMFLLRLVVQAPLYLAGWVEALGAARLAMGVPLYAATVLLAVRMVHRARSRVGALAG
jgi:hypothetical protein